MSVRSLPRKQDCSPDEAIFYCNCCSKLHTKCIMILSNGKLWRVINVCDKCAKWLAEKLALIVITLPKYMTEEEAMGKYGTLL